MPRSGGIFSLIPGYFAVDGTTIEVSQHNPVFEDVAQALTDSLPRDGSAPMTGNLPMGSNKITGLAAGTNPADAVRFDQLPTVTPTTATLTAGTDAQGQPMAFPVAEDVASTFPAYRPLPIGGAVHALAVGLDIDGRAAYALQSAAGPQRADVHEMATSLALARLEASCRVSGFLRAAL